MAYTNCDTVELFLNGKSFGAKALQFPRPGNSGSWNRYEVPPNVPVQIIVEGAGRLIGLDNGNPADHTSMKSDSRNTFKGLALAVVQPNNKPEGYRCEQIPHL